MLNLEPLHNPILFGCGRQGRWLRHRSTLILSGHRSSQKQKRNHIHNPNFAHDTYPSALQLFRAAVRFCPFVQFLSVFHRRKMNRDHQFPVRFGRLSQTRLPSAANPCSTPMTARSFFRQLPTTTLALSYCCGLFVALEKLNSLGFEQIQTLSAKHRGGVRCAIRRSVFAPDFFGFVRPLFSWSYELLSPQSLCFHNHLRCPRVWGAHD